MAERRQTADDLRRLPTAELVKQLADETGTLVRQELALFRAEMLAKGRRAGVGLGELSGAGLMALFALGALTACVIAALALVMPVWAAALIVAVVYGIVAGVLALIGRKQLKETMPPAPERTARTIKEDVEWAKTRRS